MADFVVGQKIPDRAENAVCGPISGRIARGSTEFKTLVVNSSPLIQFKDEEPPSHRGSDMVMSNRLSTRLNLLAGLVASEWEGVRLRITESWDGQGEHSRESLHYEGRAADITLSNRRHSEYGRLARLAGDAGFDWVWYEDEHHVHVSVARDLDGDWASSLQRGGAPRWRVRVRGGHGAWIERNGSGASITRKVEVAELGPGRYQLSRANDLDTLLFLGASSDTAKQILALNPPASYLQFDRRAGEFKGAEATWAGLSWRLHPNGKVRDIRMLSSRQSFSLENRENSS